MSDTPSSAVAERQLHWSFLGRVPYGPTYQLQEHLRRELRFGRGPEHLLLLEHEPVFTLGRGASADDVVAAEPWLKARGIEVHPTNRGGQVTYHGPGQLVLYCLLDLNRLGLGVKSLVAKIEESVIGLLRG